MKEKKDALRKERYSFADLLQIMEILRAPGGCPWDREQTHESIRHNFLEEVYEAADAIDKRDPDLLKEELGDVLLQVVFHAEIEKEAGRFTIDDVCDEICKKLIVRHPHIFADTQVSGSGEVLRNWDEIKKATKGQKSGTDAINDIPDALPSLMKSQKVQARAARTGFDYENIGQAIGDLTSELQEFLAEHERGDDQRAADELGDILFSCVNVARLMDRDSEELLERSCGRFKERFAVVERLARERGVDMKTSGMEALNELWAAAKTETKNGFSRE